jgi:hypothetical protein
LRAFLREYWLWILIPVLVVVVGILVLVLLAPRSNGGMVYDIF